MRVSTTALILYGLAAVVVVLFAVLLFTPPPMPTCASCSSSLFSVLGLGSPLQEGMVDVLPIQYERGPDNQPTQKIQRGYYQVDNQHMAMVPYGFVVDPADNRKIVPASEQARAVMEAKRDPTVKPPQNGEFMPDGYYLVSDSSLGVLPPAMMPAVQNVEVFGSVNPRLHITYRIGYVSEYVYYKQTFLLTVPTVTGSFVLPAGIYFKDRTRSTVSFLPPNKVADVSNGFGYLDATESALLRKVSATGNVAAKFDAAVTNYRDVSNNYDVEYHESAEDLLKKNDMGSTLDASGGIRVKDMCGNWVMLPRLDAQASPVYYQPGSYVFGKPKTYVPTYADSVYLSSWTKEPELAPYALSTVPTGMCHTFKDTPSKLEEYCSRLDGNVCASTSCCVLLGGSKCVAGDADGPTFPGHYSDVALRDKDRYYYNGACYGNCPEKF